MYQPLPRSSSRSALAEIHPSPCFRARTPDPVLSCLDVSCLPESSSPEDPVSFEQRLALKLQASQRHLEDLRQRKKKQEEGLMKDRPFVSRRSKVLAFQAEERFWKQHLERKPEREPVEVLEVATVQRPPRPVPRPTQPKPLTSYPNLKDRIRAFLRSNEGDKTPKSPLKSAERPSEHSAVLLQSSVPKLKTSRLKSTGRGLANPNDSSYRSLSPAPVNISFTQGRDFARLTHRP